MICKIEALSDRGKVRSNNEDHIMIPNEVFTDGERTVEIENSIIGVAVADGMGGHKGGEIASKMVLESLAVFLKSLDLQEGEATFRKEMDTWLEGIHHELLSSGERDDSLNGMGTTLTGLFLNRGSAFVFNAGDSRTYFLDSGSMIQLTKDHTLDRATGSPHRKSNMLLNCIGAIRKPFIDILDVSHLAKPGSLFLLCSDGLTDMLVDDEIAIHIRNNSPKELVAEANRRGGKDNISVVCVKIV